jgi:serine/threonine protein kinase
MGTVYEAIDERFNSTIALKETFFQEEALRKAFEREANLLHRLRHPAIPRVTDHFTENDGQFLVMEFISGKDLWQMIRERGGPFTTDKVLEWADQILDALEYLHSQQPPIVHRDIKPQNLKLTDEGRIILLDFGLAKGTFGFNTSIVTSRSVMGFTPNFAPLEQMQGTGTGPKSDFYSLAATLYYLMTGKVPPDALSRATAIMSEQADPLRSANEVDSKVSAEVAEVIQRAMATNPAKRPDTAAEMREALHKASKTLAPTDNQIPEGEVQSQQISLTIPSETVASPTEASPTDATKPVPSNTLFEQAEITPPSRKSKAPLLISAAIIVITIVATIIYYSSSTNSGSDAAREGETANNSTATEGSRYVVSGREGRINGKVTFKGTAPERYAIDFSQDPACASKNPNPMTEVVLIKNGNVQNVLLYIKDGQTNDGRNFRDLKFEPPSNSVNLDQIGCQYVPRVLGIQAGQKLSVTNSDPTAHNVHTLPPSGGGNVERNESQPKGAAPIVLSFERTELLIPVKCNQHPWMRASIAVLNHPFFAVSNENGSFEIRGVPAGTYTVVAWHERFGEQGASLTVTDNSSQTADFSFTSNSTAFLKAGSLKLMPALELPMLLH